MVTANYLASSGVIDEAQRKTIEELMGRRYFVAVSLFLEYTACRVEQLRHAVAQKRLPESWAPMAERVHDHAAAIGARGLMQVAHALLHAAAQPDSLRLVSYDALVATLEERFDETAAFFARYTAERSVA